MTTGQLPWHCTLCPSERLLLHLLRPKVHHALNPLQFAYQDKVGVKDAILYLLHSSRCFLDKGNGVVRIMFFFISPVHSILYSLYFWVKSWQIWGWINTWWKRDFLTRRLQYVRLSIYSSDMVINRWSLPSSSYSLWCAGDMVLRRRMLCGWTSWTARLVLWLVYSWTHLQQWLYNTK